MSHFVHDRCPAFQGDHDKDIQHTFQNVVKRCHTKVRIAPVYAFPFYTGKILAAEDVIAKPVLDFLTALVDTPIFHSASEKLSGHGAEHHQEEREQDEDIKHGWQRIQKGVHKLPHAGDGIDGAQGTQDTDDPDGRHITSRYDLTNPAHDHHSKIELHRLHT